MVTPWYDCHFLCSCENRLLREEVDVIVSSIFSKHGLDMSSVICHLSSVNRPGQRKQLMRPIDK